MTETETPRLANLLYQYQDVFSQDEFDVGRTQLIRHEIPLLENTRPIKQHPYRQGDLKDREIEQQVEQLLQQDLLEESCSPWSSPVVLVKKKNGQWLFCIDYRRVNEVTVKDAYPLPRIDDSLDALRGSEWFTTLDLTSGYWQVE